MNRTLALNLTNPAVIAEARAAVEAVYARGGLTREERAVALGNLGEAAVRLRLIRERN